MVFQMDQLLAQNSLDRMNEDVLVDLIEKNLSFSMKLLRLMNTNYKQTYKVCSIRKAISLIGLEEVQKWIQLLSVKFSESSYPAFK